MIDGWIDGLMNLSQQGARAMRRMAIEPTTPLGKLQRGVGLVRAAFLLRRCDVGYRVNVAGPMKVDNRGAIRVGDRVHFWAGRIPTELICHPGAEISIGSDTLFNYGSSIEAHASVRIGKRCMFGSLVRIEDQAGGRRAPISIGDDVWVAHGAVIEPGVTIGDGSVVAANSVVTSDVPPDSLAIGNPAKCSPLLPADAKARPTGLPEQT